ncbi:MAG: O-antigen/teichoic acid export membrane protein [Flavobacteriaceae bacterium]|jgi:O-antigen/teichoic acid export membrane protein
MFKKNIFFLNSLKYIFVSGISKGLSYVLLLYFAVGDYSEQYVTILLLLSLEQILSLILPLNQSSVIYSKSISNYQNITNRLLTSSILISSLFVILFLIFKNSIYNYFQVNLVVVYVSILANMLLNSYLVYLTNFYKVIEEHGKALLIQGLLLISFLSIIISILFIKNIIIAFFLGKTIGLVIVVILVKFLKLTKFRFEIKVLSFKEIKQVANLFSVSALGWLSSLGFMNIAKLNSTPEELIKTGYILTLFNVFLLISIGVNSIYGPMIKKLLKQNEFSKAIKVKNNVLMLYFFIAILAFLIYLLALNFNFGERIDQLISMIPYVILVYIFNVFHWVAQPYYFINNKFNKYNLMNTCSYIVWIVLIIICFNYGYHNYIWFLMFIHMLKGLMSYFYARKNFMSKSHVLIKGI